MTSPWLHVGWVCPGSGGGCLSGKGAMSEYFYVQKRKILPK